MERSKVICSIQVWGRDVGLSRKVSLDFAGLGSPCSWAFLLFLLLDGCWREFGFLLQPPLLPSLFFRRASGLLSEGTTLSSPLFFPPCAVPFTQVPLGWILHATGDDFRDAYSLGATDCVSGFPPFGHLFYSGLAGPRYLLEKNFWEDSECRLAACSCPLFHAVSPSPGLVKLPCALQSTGMR